MGSKLGKCIKQQCAILLIFNSMAHCHDRSMLSRMGTRGLLWGRSQFPRVFDGPVNRFAVFTVLFGCPAAADIAAVLVVI